MVAFTVMSCSKGTTGPQGPQGPAGPDSVIYSTWTAINLTWNATDLAFEQSISAPAITQDILDNGVILSYLDIPSQSGDQVVDALNFVTTIFSVGNVQLITDSSGEQVVQGEGFRYVIIPGSMLASSALSQYTKGQIKDMSYAQITQLVGDKAKYGGN